MLWTRVVCREDPRLFRLSYRYGSIVLSTSLIYKSYLLVLSMICYGKRRCTGTLQKFTSQLIPHQISKKRLGKQSTNYIFIKHTSVHLLV